MLNLEQVHISLEAFQTMRPAQSLSDVCNAECQRISETGRRGHMHLLFFFTGQENKHSLTLFFSLSQKQRNYVLFGTKTASPNGWSNYLRFYGKLIWRWALIHRECEFVPRGNMNNETARTGTETSQKLQDGVGFHKVKKERAHSLNCGNIEQGLSESARSIWMLWCKQPRHQLFFSDRAVAMTQLCLTKMLGLLNGNPRVNSWYRGN